MITLFLFACSLALTYLIKIKAPSIGLVDVPNDRSSHHVPTPRGGGLAIIITFFAVLTSFHNSIDSGLFGALCMALPVALVGFVDDLHPLSAKLRMSVQFVSALGALLFLGGVQNVQFGLFELSGLWLNGIALFVIVWLTNLYNFLDGIDGYAASEGLFVTLGAFLLFGNVELLWLASAIAGFLVLNWQKASIFMGDVGSATLGFMFAVWMLHDAGSGHALGWVILLSLFWFDATVTLLRRWRNRERLTQAHKKHMYQRLQQSGFSHAHVVLSGMGINVLMFAGLYVTPARYHLYLLGLLIMILYAYLKFIDLRKGFE